jgi:hypothetical protein
MKSRFVPPFLRMVLLAFVSAAAVRATSVVAPSFPELVAEAETIARARVAATECRWVTTPQGRVIKTYVTLTVLKTLKGSPQATLTLELLGGELDGEGMRVEGMPTFAVGAEEIVFVAGNRIRFCPLVAMMHGRYRVLTDPSTARTYIARNDRVPLEREDDVQLPQRQTAGGPARRMARIADALSPEAFEEKIAAEISRRAQP